MRNAIILAAGKGTRMKSSQSKVMHSIIDRPMLAYIIDALRAVHVERIVVVVGYQAQTIEATFKDVEFALQEPQLGTGHAVMQCQQLANETGDTIIINGDGPCIQPETLEKLFQANETASATLCTAILEDAGAYGRIVRDQANNVIGIVEAKDCDPEQLKIKEINAGIYCFKNQDLFASLDKLEPNNAQHEYYLTDLISILSNQGKTVNGMVIENREEVMDINDCKELYRAYTWMTNHINSYWLEQGVQIIDPKRTMIGKDVKIGHDVIIYPNVEITGKTQIGNGVIIRSNSRIVDSTIQDGVTIDASIITSSQIDQDTQIGPMTAITNCQVDRQCRLKSFERFENEHIAKGQEK